MKKRLVAALVAAMMVASMMVTPAFAIDLAEVTTNEKTTPWLASTTEYDMLLQIKEEKKQLENALPLSVSENVEQQEEYIEELKSFNPEEAILIRASIPEEQLQIMGYTNEQIAILKEYDGSPIEENPQLRAVLGKLWATILKLDYSKNSAAARFSWKWTNQPIITGVFSDIVSCAWRGVGRDNQEETMTIDLNNSTCNVKYVSEDGSLSDKYVTYDINDKDPQRNAEVKFRLTDSGRWAESGYFDVYIEEEATVNNMDTSLFIFAYGHTNFTVSPSISVSGSGPSLGLSCGVGTDEMFNEWLKIKYTGVTEASYT